MALPAVLIAGLALILVQFFGIRRLGTRRARYVWLAFAPVLMLPVLLVWSAFNTASQPIVALFILLVGLFQGALVVRTVRGVARGTATAETQDEIMTAIEEPSTDFMLITTIVGVLAMIVLGVAMIAVAVAERGR